MADVLPKNGEKSLKLADRADFCVGHAWIRPSLRIVEGPTGSSTTEPRVMQVLLMILDANGIVVSRDDLIRRCWDNRVVGDDVVSRAIAEARKALRASGAGFEIETIPKVGYRLVGAKLASVTPQGRDELKHTLLSRRTLVVGGVAAAGGIGGLLTLRKLQEGRQFDALLERGSQALLYGDPSADPSRFFRLALTLRPNDAEALGMLAYADSIAGEFAGPQDSRPVLLDADRSARKSLEINPREPHARLAMTILKRSTLDYSTTEDRLRSILDDAPTNIPAMKNLWNLLQSVGRSRDALRLVDKANAMGPLAALSQFPHAQLLWISGRNAEADRVIDRALQFWPNHRFVRFARFIIYAFTERQPAALAMLDDPNARPQQFTDPATSLWRVSLAAMNERSDDNIAAARRANLDAARKAPALTYQAVMVLSALGEIDSAFELANEFLSGGGDAPRGSSFPPHRIATRGTAWRFTPWLFTPPLANLRSDRRFKSLCDGLGLSDYWRRRRILPDYPIPAG